MGVRSLEIDVRRDRSGYWARVRGLEGCVATGGSLDELIVVLRDAIATHLDEPAATGMLVPVSGIPVKSGRTCAAPILTTRLQRRRTSSTG